MDSAGLLPLELAVTGLELGRPAAGGVRPALQGAALLVEVGRGDFIEEEVRRPATGLFHLGWDDLRSVLGTAMQTTPREVLPWGFTPLP